MTQQRFVLDGQPVSYCEGGFAAKFDMDSADAENTEYGDTVVLVVVARMGLPGFRETKEGEVVRINKFEVKAARVADEKTGLELAEMFDIDIQQKLPYTPAGVAAAAAVPAAPAIPPPRAPKPPTTAGVVPTPASSSNGAGVSVPTGAPVTGPLHAHDDALREFLDA